jgi:hypothetical protein
MSLSAAQGDKNAPIYLKQNGSSVFQFENVMGQRMQEKFAAQREGR